MAGQDPGGGARRPSRFSGLGEPNDSSAHLTVNAISVSVWLPLASIA
jgi:hypothetical protein